jgi:NTE family protein
MNKIPFESISVKNITDHANIARLTFYRNFKSKEDIINHKSTEICMRIENTLLKEGGDVLDKVANIMISEKTFLKLLIKQNLDYMFRRVFEKTLEDIHKKHLHIFIEDRYSLKSHLGAFSGVVIEYLTTEKKPSKTKLYRVLKETLKIEEYNIPKQQKVIGLCLSGGGARGAYEIGAVQALEDLGIYQKIKYFSGASIGAANVALLASTKIEEAKKVWFDMPKNPLVKNEGVLKKIKEEKLKALEEGIYSMDMFEQIMMQHVNIENFNDNHVFISISESGDQSKGLSELIKQSMKHHLKKDSKAHYVHLNELTNQQALNVVEASCSIPVVFSPVIIENRKYYDGGVFDNTPIQPLIDSGCNEIILINIAFFNTKKKVQKAYPNIMIHEIKSKKKLGGILDFSKEHSQMLFDLGYKETMEYFKSNKID